MRWEGIGIGHEHITRGVRDRAFRSMGEFAQSPRVGTREKCSLDEKIGLLYKENVMHCGSILFAICRVRRTKKGYSSTPFIRLDAGGHK